VIVKRAALLLAVAAAVLLSACGGDDGPTVTDTDTVTLPTLSAGKVYWVRDGKVWPAARELPATNTETAALEELFAGPTDQEEADLEFETAIPERDESVEISRLEISDGAASFSPPRDLTRRARAQVVYTLTQFPTIESVEIDGQRYTRADFDEQTPSVLVESPLPFEGVTSPIRVTGTANTFEATFHYTLTDTDGLIVDENFVTATSGTGTRGTFEFTTDEYTVPFDGIGALIVFERSAEDGSKMNIVEIPLRMSR
jgi:germination protein M